MNSKLSKLTQVIISTYNPEINLLRKNLQAILKQFCNVLIVDDGSNNIIDIKKLLEDKNNDIEIKELGQNFGIARTQNIGLQTAINKKMEWILTMDQDSIIPDNFSIEYQKVIEKYDNLGLIGWNQNLDSDQPEIKEDWWILSSGCLLNVKVLKECGGFDEQLFIDHVDTDVCIKMRNHKYKTLVTSKVKLFHQLGEETTKKTFRGAVYHEHSPIRVYYIVRNGIVLFRRYFFKQPAWTIHALKVSIRESIYLLHFQPNKFKNFRLLLKAWFDGIFNQLGRYK